MTSAINRLCPTHDRGRQVVNPGMPSRPQLSPLLSCHAHPNRDRVVSSAPDYLCSVTRRGDRSRTTGRFGPVTPRLGAIGVDLTMAEGAGGDCGKRTTTKRKVRWRCGLASRRLGQLGAGAASNSRRSRGRHSSVRADTRHRSMQRWQLSSPRSGIRRLRPHPVRGPSGRGNRRRALLFHRAAAMGIPGAGMHVGTASHRGGGPDHHVPKPAASRPPAICAQKARPAGWVVSRAFALDYCSAASRFSLAFVAPRALSASASFFAASR